MQSVIAISLSPCYSCPMAITIYSGQVIGLDARPILVEVDITPGLHVFTIVGLADKEVQESRERISAAIKNIGALAPNKKSQRVIVNLAPADIKKEGPAFDLAIALGYLLCSGQIVFNPKEILFLGELGLDGTLRRVSGVLPLAIAARDAGFRRILVPKHNGVEAAILDGIEIIEAETLFDVIEMLAGRKEITPLAHRSFKPEIAQPDIDLKDIKGQEKAKRALAVAAAGNHNMFMSGPPGSGKTILARAFAHILPPLSFEESIESTKIYSVAGLLGEGKSCVTERPFRNPHHTASSASILGGGTTPRPGEVTLAHRGVLFLDELPEFERRVIESLRQPLEDRTITISRANGSQTFPAQFILLAAQNPCPCGNFGNQRVNCTCSPNQISSYTKKISGPILDRIDIHITVPAVDYDSLHSAGGESSAMVRERVSAARERQLKRFAGLPIRTNAEMGLREIKQFIPLTDSLTNYLRLAHERYHLSARAYHRVLKLARTIADLHDSDEISDQHLLEALQYRAGQEV